MASLFVCQNHKWDEPTERPSKWGCLLFPAAQQSDLMGAEESLDRRDESKAESRTLFRTTLSETEMKRRRRRRRRRRRGAQTAEGPTGQGGEEGGEEGGMKDSQFGRITNRQQDFQHGVSLFGDMKPPPPPLLLLPVSSLLLSHSSSPPSVQTNSPSASLKHFYSCSCFNNLSLWFLFLSPVVHFLSDSRLHYEALWRNG